VTDAKRVESLWRRGDIGAAIALAESVAGGDDRLAVAEALLRCARDLENPESERAALLAVRLRQSVWPPGHPRAGYSAMPLADFLAAAGRLEDAAAVLESCEALALDASSSAPGEAVRDATFARAEVLLALGQNDQAEAALLRAAEIEEKNRHPKRPPVALPLVSLRALYVRLGRDRDAAAVAEREEALYRKSGYHLSVEDKAIFSIEWGQALIKAGEPLKAKRILASAIKTLGAAHDPGSESLKATLHDLLSQASQKA
jgi:tetratricopeptide (TPR) repeat protein